jgi:hypothetical protein
MLEHLRTEYVSFSQSAKSGGRTLKFLESAWINGAYPAVKKCSRGKGTDDQLDLKSLDRVQLAHVDREFPQVGVEDTGADCQFALRVTVLIDTHNRRVADCQL